jgi:hypothetical protein
MRSRNASSAYPVHTLGKLRGWERQPADKWPTQARGDESGHRDYRDRYRALAASLGFEGHMKLAEAMTQASPASASHQQGFSLSMQVPELALD